MYWFTGSPWADLGAMQSKAGVVEEQGLSEVRSAMGQDHRSMEHRSWALG